MSEYSKEQFDALQAELKAARAQAGVAEKMASELQAVKSQLESRDSAHQREMAFVGAGLNDPSVREVFGLHYDRQAASEGGIKNPAEWLAALANDPEKVPPVLSALMPKQKEQKATPQAQPASQQGQWLPQPNGSGVRAAPPAGPAFSAEQINSMSLNDFSKNYEAIVASHPELKRSFSPRLPWGPNPAGKGA